MIVLFFAPSDAYGRNIVRNGKFDALIWPILKRILIMGHSAIGYIAPTDKLNQRETEIFDQRRQKLTQAREQRKLFWQGTERLQ